MKARKRGVLAAICVMASLGVGAGQLADGAMHQANAARKHLAGVKYEDIPSTKPTKSATGAAHKSVPAARPDPESQHEAKKPEPQGSSEE